LRCRDASACHEATRVRRIQPMKNKILGAALALVCAVPFLHPAEPPLATPDPAARLAQLRKLISELKPQSGEIVLRGGLAKATLPPSLRYLNPTDTQTVLQKIWGNPGGGQTLGMLVPDKFNPLTTTVGPSSSPSRRMAT